MVQTSLHTYLRQELVTGHASERRVEELDRMDGRERPAGAAKRLRYLDQAARVRAGVRVGLGLQHPPALPVAQLARRLGLHDVVDPGAATADRLVCGLRHLENRDTPAQPH